MAIDLEAESRLPVDGFHRKSKNPSEAAGTRNGVRPWHLRISYATTWPHAVAALEEANRDDERGTSLARGA